MTEAIQGETRAAAPQARRRLLALQLLGGPAVLGSYVWCFVARPEATAQMWGGVPDGLRTLYTAWMFVAAAGYFAYSYVFLIRGKPDADSDRLLAGAYNLVLWPSALWMPATAWMLEAPSLTRFWLVRLDLFAVALGTVGLIAAAARIELPPDPPSPGSTFEWRRLALVGTLAFAVQTIVLDAIIWPALFPLP